MFVQCNGIDSNPNIHTHEINDYYTRSWRWNIWILLRLSRLTKSNELFPNLENFNCGR